MASLTEAQKITVIEELFDVHEVNHVNLVHFKAVFYEQKLYLVNEVLNKAWNTEYDEFDLPSHVIHKMLSFPELDWVTAYIRVLENKLKEKDSFINTLLGN